MDAARANTRGLAAEFRSSAESRQADIAGTSELKRRIGATVVQLDELNTIRAQVDSRTIDRGAAAAAYTAVVDGIFRVYDALGSLDDETIATQAAALIDLNRQYELISQEDALVTGILAAARITPPSTPRSLNSSGRSASWAPRPSATWRAATGPGTTGCSPATRSCACGPPRTG